VPSTIFKTPFGKDNVVVVVGIVTVSDVAEPAGDVYMPVVPALCVHPACVREALISLTSPVLVVDEKAYVLLTYIPPIM
jgi:hypothetical protein